MEQFIKTLEEVKEEEMKEFGFVRLKKEDYTGPKSIFEKRYFSGDTYRVFAFSNENGYKFYEYSYNRSELRFALKLDDLFLYRVGYRLRTYDKQLNSFMREFDEKFSKPFYNYCYSKDYFDKLTSELDEYLDRLSKILNTLKIVFYHFQDCYIVNTYTNFRVKEFVKGQVALSKLPDECEKQIKVIELVEKQ